MTSGRNFFKTVLSRFNGKLGFQGFSRERTGVIVLSSVHDQRSFISVPLAACGKLHLECRFIGELYYWRSVLCIRACVSFGGNDLAIDRS